MSTETTETSEGGAAGPGSDGNRAVSTAERLARDGRPVTLAGAALLGWLLQGRRERGPRSGLLALLSVGLLGLGLRQRRTAQAADAVETEADVRRDERGNKAVSDEAHVEAASDLGAGRNADEEATVYESGGEFNPRGTADGADLARDDGGDVDFVDGKEPGTYRETDLPDESAHDTRLNQERDRDRTEVDLSRASLADEASEAAGPQPEQAYPAREGTDPEPASDEAPPRLGQGAVAPAGPDDEAAEGDAADEMTDDEATGSESSDDR